MSRQAVSCGTCCQSGVPTGTHIQEEEESRRPSWESTGRTYRGSTRHCFSTSIQFGKKCIIPSPTIRDDRKRHAFTARRFISPHRPSFPSANVVRAPNRHTLESGNAGIQEEDPLCRPDQATAQIRQSIPCQHDSFAASQPSRICVTAFPDPACRRSPATPRQFAQRGELGGAAATRCRRDACPDAAEISVNSPEPSVTPACLKPQPAGDGQQRLIRR